MKTIKRLSELVDLTTSEKFLMKCPTSGVVHLMAKRRSSNSQHHHYMSRQGYSRGRGVLLRALTPFGRRHHLTRDDLQTEGIKYVLSCRG